MGMAKQEEQYPHPLADKIDKGILMSGSVIAWANFLLIVVTLLQVVLRYGFNHGLVILEELEWHFYSVAFMFGLAYALTTNSHVRVDVIQSRFSDKTKAWIDLLGHVFLLMPFVLVVIYYGWEFTSSSFRLAERSDAPLGLPFRWIIKGVIPISFIMLGMATLSRILRTFAIVRGK